NTTREISPPRVLISARLASACSVPWSIVTPPDSTVGVASSRLPTCLPALMSIGLLRSDLRAMANGLATIATATSIQPASRRTLARWGKFSGDIAGADLGLEGVLLAGQVHLETIAAKYRAGSINGDRDGRGHPVVFGE